MKDIVVKNLLDLVIISSGSGEKKGRFDDNAYEQMMKSRGAM